MSFFQQTGISGVWLIKPRLFNDARGSFFEPYNHAKYKEIVGDTVFVQDNESYSTKGVLRGLHFQRGSDAQSKLVRVARGSVKDVVVDLRISSPTYGKHEAFLLDDVEKHQLFIPKGIAHGFLVLSEDALFSYKVDTYYSPQNADGLLFNDKTLGIDWGIQFEELLVAEKDMSWPTFENAYKFE